MRRPETLIREYDRVKRVDRFTLFSYVRPRKNGEITVETWGACRHASRKDHPLVFKKYFVHRSDSRIVETCDTLEYSNWSQAAPSPHVMYDKRFCGGQDIYAYAYSKVGGSWSDMRGKWCRRNYRPHGINPRYTVMLNGFDGTKFRYCAYDENCGMDVKGYVDLFREHPLAEIVSKSKCFQLLDGDFLAHCENDADLRKYVFHERDYIFRHCKSPKSVLAAYARGTTLSEYDRINGAAARKRRAMTEARRAERDAKRLAENDARILALYKRIKSICGSHGAYEVYVPKSSAEMIAEGAAMHNCIGYLYADLQGDSDVCVFLRKSGKPYVDIRIDYKTFKVCEVRTVCNADAGKEMWAIARELAERVSRIGRTKKRKSKKVA